MRAITASAGLVLLSSVASAQASIPTGGIGSVLGIGVSSNVIPTLTPPPVTVGPQADLGPLAVRFFLPNGRSIDLHSQIGTP